ncbi:hypothetical protein DFH11DRAFT_1544211 [Phellopilus nigrolimitatus]|nr:hypothetical protein DFH11DRAFT_1544211 [Phellopilus nigrolimitatus]
MKLSHNLQCRSNLCSDSDSESHCVAVLPHANNVAVGFDEGVVVVKLGCDEPALSMDSTGKLVYTRSTDVLSANLQTVTDVKMPEGQRIHLPVRKLGSTELYVTSLQHSPNGALSLWSVTRRSASAPSRRRSTRRKQRSSHGPMHRVVDTWRAEFTFKDRKKLAAAAVLLAENLETCTVSWSSSPRQPDN